MAVCAPSRFERLSFTLHEVFYRLLCIDVLRNNCICGPGANSPAYIHHDTEHSGPQNGIMLALILFGYVHMYMFKSTVFVCLVTKDTTATGHWLPTGQVACA